MPRSPVDGSHLARYEDAWEAINRMIRDGGSWSGFERDCFFLSTGDGTFVNASAASGLDFIEDGRAAAVLDLDVDGAPDLALKNRGTPQIRLLRNEAASGNASIWLLLEGKKPSNRDAVGARVTLRSGGRTRAREVVCGNGFLSQGSRWLHFGLGGARSAQVDIRWPSGRRQAVGDLAAGFRYRIVEGESPAREPFRAPPKTGGGGPAPIEEKAGGGAEEPLRSIWLLAEAPLPRVAFTGLDGKPLAPGELRGRPLLLNFFSRRCAPCDSELRLWVEKRELIERMGLEVLAVSVDGGDAEARQGAAAYLAERRFQFAAAAADDRAIAAYGVLIHQAARWPAGLVVPTSILVDHSGSAARIYQGAVPWERLVDDAVMLHQAADRTPLALPFRGVHHAGPFHRDFFQLGLGYWERGLEDLALESFDRWLELRPDDADTHYNIGVLRMQSDEIAGAAASFRRALEIDGDFVDARTNLGAALARSGDLEGAMEEFDAALRLRPGYTEALLNRAQVLGLKGDLEAAIAAYEELRAAEPSLPEIPKRLGEVYRRRGDGPRAEAALREALRLDPDDAEARSNLAVVLASGGRLEEARAELEKALERRPRYAAALNNLGLVEQALGDLDAAERSFRSAAASDPRRAEPVLNLARLLLRREHPAAARAALESFLAGNPAHEAARALRDSIPAED